MDHGCEIRERSSATRFWITSRKGRNSTGNVDQQAVPDAVWLCKSTLNVKCVSVFNSHSKAGVPGLFQSAGVEALAPTMNGSIKEFFAGRAEVVPMVARSMKPPLAYHSPTAVEGRVFVDGIVVATTAATDFFLSHPVPVAVPTCVNPSEVAASDSQSIFIS